MSTSMKKIVKKCCVPNIFIWNVAAIEWRLFLHLLKNKETHAVMHTRPLTGLGGKLELKKKLAILFWEAISEGVIKEIRKFAQKAMGTTDVRVDVKLYKHVWSRGIRNGPGELVSILRIREMMRRSKGGVFLTSHCCRDPSRGLKGIGYQGHWGRRSN